MLIFVLVLLGLGAALGFAWCVFGALRKITSKPRIAGSVILIEAAMIASLLLRGEAGEGARESGRARAAQADDGGSVVLSALGLTRE